MTGRLSVYLWGRCRTNRFLPIGVSLFPLGGLKPVAPTAQVIQPPPAPRRRPLKAGWMAETSSPGRLRGECT